LKSRLLLSFHFSAVEKINRFSVADYKVGVMLFEPAATFNTGSNPGGKTIAQPAWV
jgi:hypothetical protein